MTPPPPPLIADPGYVARPPPPSAGRSELRGRDSGRVIVQFQRERACVPP